MATYYYPSASLPMLAGPDQPPPISREEMLDVCRRFVPERDFRSLIESTLNPDDPVSPGICGPLHEWERSVRNNLVRLRAADQGLNPENYLRDAPEQFGTGVIAHEAMTGKNPLESELYLDRCRWEKIDELSTGHYFDLEFLRAYRLKLQILERHVMFEEETGFAAYRDIYSRVLSASGADNPTGGRNE